MSLHVSCILHYVKYGACDMCAHCAGRAGNFLRSIEEEWSTFSDVLMPERHEKDILAGSEWMCGSEMTCETGHLLGISKYFI